MDVLKLKSHLITTFVVLLCLIPLVCTVPREDEPVVVEIDNQNSGTGRQCTFFGDHRVSQAESSLINCSWYKSNSCCRRTEVTSVFSGMMALKGASTHCANMMHYMMCYFCSPFQSVWYQKRVIICKRFCDAVYKQCRTATYKGLSLESQYKGGRHFCEEGQNFEVVDQDVNCFDFDPTVFSRSWRPDPKRLLIVSGLVTWFGVHVKNAC